MADDSILIQIQLGAPTRANINAVTRQIQGALGNLNADVQITNGRQAEQTLQNIRKGAKQAQGAMTTFGEAIGLSARRFVAFTSAVAIVGRLTSALSQATREAIKFEREFVKLAQVFDTDVKSLGNLQNSLSDLSREFGLSATVIAKTSVVLAQSGLTARQTEQAMRTLAKTTLAATFDSIASSTEGAVAIMAQFGTEASKLETQLGAINAVSKKFAVESGDIIEAVRRAGGAFRAAGGNLTEFISLFTAVRSTTRESAETIATGFRTIFARLQRPKTIDFFRQLNIELTDGKGNFIGAFEAIKRLSTGLEQAGIKAGSLKFAAIVEQLGGIRQVSRVIPLLQEFTKAERARQVAIAGGGSLDKDAAKAQETLAQSFARTTENFRALIREITQTGTFQAFVKIALGLANAFIEVARSIKPLIPLIAALGALSLGKLASGALKSGVTGAGGAGGLGKGFNKGGKVLGFNRGGTVPGTGSGDTVPAMLEPGEFVIRKSAVKAFGADRLSGINKYNGGTGKKGVPKPKKKSYQPNTEKGQKGVLTNESFVQLGKKQKGGLSDTSVTYGELKDNKLKLDPQVVGGLKGGLFEKFINSKKGIKVGSDGGFPDLTKTSAMSLIGGSNLDGGELKYGLTEGTVKKYRKSLKNSPWSQNFRKKNKGTEPNVPMIYAEKFAKGGKAEREYGGINLTGSGGSVVAKYGDGPATGEVNAVPSASNASLFTVASSSATKGYGPRLYDAVMEKVTQLGGQLTSDRSRVSRDAERVWKHYLTKRPDVQKTPLSPKDWYSGPLFDQKKFASEDPNTWPPHNDESWALLTGYSKSPSLIKDSKKVKHFAEGGPAGTDTVPALLTPGEFVINKKSAEAFGYNGLEKINKYAKGGPVGVQKFAEGGGVNFGGVFFALSIGLTTLTNLLEGVSGEFKAISDSLLAFGVASAAAFKVLSTLTSVNLPRFIGNKVKGLADKAKGSLSGGDEVETTKQLSSIRAASGSNDKHLITINRTLLSLLKETQIISVRAGQSAGRYGGSEARAREDRIGRTSQSGSVLRKIRRSGPGAGDVPESVAPKTGIFKKLGGVFGKIVTKAAILNSVMGLLAGAVGLVSAHFTLLASTAEQAKEKAIKEGNQETAVRKAGEESRAKANKKAALSAAAAGAALGTFAGPIGTLVGAAAGLAAGLLLGSKGMDSLILVMGQFAKSLVQVIKTFSFLTVLDIDWDAIEGAVDSFTVNLLSSTSEFKNKLEGLSKATQAASENITKSLGEKFDVEQKAFTLATTDSGREKSIQRQTEILLEHGRKFDETNGKLAEQTAKIEEERNNQLAGLGNADQGQKDAANKTANDAIEKAKEQNIKLLEQESSTRLDSISKLSQQASTAGQSLQVERDLNKGKKLTRDQDNIIRRDSLQANGELISIFEALKTAGVSERDAMIRITQSLDGATSAAKQFSETLKNQSKAVGGIFRQLFTGPLEESFKVAQKLNDAMDVAEGSQSISGLGRERGNAAADAFGQFMSIGAVTGEQTDAAFKGAIPESAYKGLKDALTRKITSEEGAGSPEAIAEKVQQGMRKAAEGFFGADVVANENRDYNKRTAEAVEALTEPGGGEGGEGGEVKAKTKAIENEILTIQDPHTNRSLQTAQIDPPDKKINPTPPKVKEALTDSITQKVTSEDPTASPEVIAEKVEEGVRRATENTTDPVASETQDNTKRTAEGVEKIAEGLEGGGSGNSGQSSSGEGSGTGSGNGSGSGEINYPDIKPEAIVKPFWMKIRDAIAAVTLDSDNRQLGGMIYANEGALVNFQPKGTDTVPAMLTPGEFVIKKSSVDKYKDILPLINAGNYADGGAVKANYLANGGRLQYYDKDDRSKYNVAQTYRQLEDGTLEYDNRRYAGSYGRGNIKTGQKISKEDAKTRVDQDHEAMMVKYFDKDGDGSISQEENSAYLRNKQSELSLYMKAIESVDKDELPPNVETGKPAIKQMLEAMWPMENPQEQLYTERDYENYLWHSSGRESRAVRGYKNASKQNKQSIRDTPFSEKWAGPLAFLEREFRPFLSGGTAAFQGVIGAGHGVIGGLHSVRGYQLSAMGRLTGDQNIKDEALQEHIRAQERYGFSGAALTEAGAAGESFAFDVSGGATREAFAGVPAGQQTAEKLHQANVEAAEAGYAYRGEQFNKGRQVGEELPWYEDLAFLDMLATEGGKFAAGSLLDSPMAALRAGKSIIKVVGGGGWRVAKAGAEGSVNALTYAGEGARALKGGKTWKMLTSMKKGLTPAEEAAVAGSQSASRTKAFLDTANRLGMEAKKKAVAGFKYATGMVDETGEAVGRNFGETVEGWAKMKPGQQAAIRNAQTAGEASMDASRAANQTTKAANDVVRKNAAKWGKENIGPRVKELKILEKNKKALEAELELAKKTSLPEGYLQNIPTSQQTTRLPGAQVQKKIAEVTKQIDQEREVIKALNAERIKKFPTQKLLTESDITTNAENAFKASLKESNKTTAVMQQADTAAKLDDPAETMLKLDTTPTVPKPPVDDIVKQADDIFSTQTISTADNVAGLGDDALRTTVTTGEAAAAAKQAEEAPSLIKRVLGWFKRAEKPKTAPKGAVADSTKKQGIFRRLGRWLLGRTKAGAKRVVTSAWDLKKLGILGSQAISNPRFMSWVDELFSGGSATSEAAADAQATDALEGAADGGGGAGGAGGAGSGAAKPGAATQAKSPESIRNQLREKLIKQYIDIKYPTIAKRFADEEASDKAGRKDFGLGSDAATKWLYDKWRSEELSEGLSQEEIIGNIGHFRRDARKYRTEKVNSMSREDKKAYMNARIYGKSRYGEGMASQGYQHTFAGTVGDAENKKRTVLYNRGVGAAAGASSGAMTGASIAPGGIGAAIGAAIGATIGAGIGAIKPELDGAMDFAGGAMDKLMGLLDQETGQLSKEEKKRIRDQIIKPQERGQQIPLSGEAPQDIGNAQLTGHFTDPEVLQKQMRKSKESVSPSPTSSFGTIASVDSLNQQKKDREALDKKAREVQEKMFKGYNTGGYVNGPAGIDVIPAYLSRGEFVMKSSAVNNIGRDNLTKMNAQNFYTGGDVGKPETSTMNPMKIEGGKELLEAGRILKDAAKTIPTAINMTVDQLPAVDANIKIDGGQIVGTIKSAVEEWVGAELDTRFRDYELKQQSGGG